MNWSGRYSSRPDQRGAITIMTAGFLMLAVLSLTLVVDTGRLYLEKRKLQRVADMAAIEAVARGGTCNGSGGAAQTFATEGAARNGFVVGSGLTLLADCGDIASVNGERQLVPDPDSTRAIRVRVTHSVPASLIAGGIFGNAVTLNATAIATKGVPLAALTLRTTLVAVDSTQGALLNSVFGGLLGGAVTLDVLGWNGLLGTDIELFQFMDALAVDLGLDVGSYDEVLGSDVTVGRLIDVAVSTLQQGGGTGDVNAAIAGLNLLKLGVGPTVVQLGDLLSLQNGTPRAGSELNLNLFQLVQGMVQLANGSNAAVADITLPVPGIGNVSVKLKVIEPPQLSAIGNPNLIDAMAPDTGPTRIFVRSAQVRTLISMDLGGTFNIVNGVLNGVLAVASPVTSFLNNTLSLGLVQALGNFLGGLVCPVFLVIPECPSRQTGYIKVLPNARVDIALDAGGARAYVTDHSCGAAGSKTLNVQAHTSAADLRLGKLGNSAAEAATNVFASDVLPVPQTIPLLELGRQTVKPDSCLLALCSGLKYKQGASWVANRDLADFTVDAGLGLNTASEVFGASDAMVYTAPPANELPEIAEDPYFKTAASGNDQLVSSLSNTLAGVTLTSYASTGSGVVGTLLNDAVGVLNSLKSQLQSLISAVLTPLLQPLVTFLLNNLGLDLGNADVGARLSCSSQEGVTLVQ